MSIATVKTRPRINYALAGALIAQGVTLADAAIKAGAKNANVLACGLRRKGITCAIARSVEPTAKHIQTVAARVANQASDILRQDMGELLQTHIGQLKQVPAVPDLKHLAQVGAVLEPLVRSAKIVHDWGNEQSLGIVALGIVEHLDQAQDALEVQSSVVPTTTESVPLETPNPENTQG